MKRFIKAVTMAFLFITVLSVGMLSGASDIWAQDTGGALTQQIQGSRILVSVYNERDGGPHP